jgi:Activator of aromatic catabolism
MRGNCRNYWTTERRPASVARLESIRVIRCAITLRGAGLRASDLDHHELLDLESTRGIIRFALQRALILDTVALGLLRRQLIYMLGVEASRGLLTRLGYAHAGRTAA